MKESYQYNTQPAIIIKALITSKLIALKNLRELWNFVEFYTMMWNFYSL